MLPPAARDAPARGCGDGGRADLQGFCALLEPRGLVLRKVGRPPGDARLEAAHDFGEPFGLGCCASGAALGQAA